MFEIELSIVDTSVQKGLALFSYAAEHRDYQCFQQLTLTTIFFLLLPRVGVKQKI